MIATGTMHQQLPAAEDGAFGGDVTYLLEARPGRFVGRDVVVIGGGDSGTLDALELATSGLEGLARPSLGGAHARATTSSSRCAASRASRSSPDGSWSPSRVASASRP